MTLLLEKLDALPMWSLELSVLGFTVGLTVLVWWLLREDEE